MKLIHVTRQFPVIVEQDPSGGYVVECPAFEGCFSQGESIDEALKNIKEAIALCFDETDADLVPKDLSMHLVSVQA